MSIESTLTERGNRYGDFTDHARLCQQLKFDMMSFSVTTQTDDSITSRIPWMYLADAQKQALEVIADKIARILSGDPNYADNWHDIQGYAKLVEDRLPQPAEGLFDEAAAVAAKAAADVDLQQMRSAGTPIDPAEHLQRVAGMAITFGELVAIMDAYIKAGDTGGTYTEYEARMLGKDQAPINPADVDISDNSHPWWKDAPDWANYLAQDGDGSWYWYEHPIYAREDYDAWYEQHGFGGRIDDAGVAAERNPDWRNTRQARPTK